MALKLYPPGTRKGNRHYCLVGRVRGKYVERSAGRDLTRQQAEDWRATAEAHLRSAAAGVADDAAPTTFADACDLYIAHRRPAPDQSRWVERLRADQIGAMRVGDVRQRHIADAAERLCPAVSNATKNRQVYIPAAAVIHYAAENDLCGWLRVRLLKTDRRAAPRTFGAENMGRLIEAAREAQAWDVWRLLVGLAYQGWRIGEFLALTWDRVRLDEGIAEVRVGKARTWKRVPLHPEFAAALRTQEPKRGPVFPWRTRWGVYRELAPLCERLGLHFTPHMARHDFATDLNAAQHTLDDIKAAGTWTSTHAIGRYVEVTETRAKSVLTALPKRKA